MNITLDPEHGLNPSLSTCFLCGESNEIILFGRLTPSQRKALKAEGGKAPRNICMDKTPCSKCAEYMEQGVILISVDESRSSDTSNPYRTGGWCVVKEEAVKRWGLKPQELEDQIIESRVAFIPDELWNILGLPPSTH